MEIKAKGMMMNNYGYKKNREEQELLRELEEYRKSGCRIFLNGRPSRDSRVVDACLREQSSYMRDYVSDDQQRIRKVDFIQIKEKD